MSLRVRMRQALPEAMRARDKAAVSALRATLAALDNAEAAPVDQAEVRGLALEQSPVGAGASEQDLMRLAAELRQLDLRVGTYLGSSTKLGRQLKWAHDQKAHFTVLYGPEERAAGEVTLRDMRSGDQTRVPLPRAAAHLRSALQGA